MGPTPHQAGTVKTQTAAAETPVRKTSPFAAAVAAGIALLGNLATLHPEVISGSLERSLRYELDRLGRAATPSGTSEHAVSRHPAAAAVSTACSHLATRAYEDAYLALLTARSLL